MPERLAVLVGRLLSPNPDDRPQTGQEVAVELTDIARQYGIESSGPHIAHFLAQLFPSDGDALDGDGGVVRVVLDEMGSMTSKERSTGTTGSVSPDGSSVSHSISHSSSHRGGFPSVDVSETYQWRSTERSVQVPSAPQRASPRTASPRSASPAVGRASSPVIARTSSPNIARPPRPAATRSSPESARFPRLPQQPGVRIVRISLVAVIVIALASAVYLFVFS